jgi:hypothetical protein
VSVDPPRLDSVELFVPGAFYRIVPMMGTLSVRGRTDLGVFEGETSWLDTIFFALMLDFCEALD